MKKKMNKEILIFKKKKLDNERSQLKVQKEALIATRDFIDREVLKIKGRVKSAKKDAIKREKLLSRFIELKSRFLFQKKEFKKHAIKVEQFYIKCEHYLSFKEENEL